MKPILTILALLLCQLAQSQDTSFRAAKNWRLYDISADDLFEYSVDTLKNFHYIKLDADSMKGYLATLSKVSEESPPLWMGAHVATYELNAAVRKVEISLYGGFFYDETTRRHFLLPDDQRDAWLAYIRQSFMAINKSK
jgi:hypothetical protein